MIFSNIKKGNMSLDILPTGDIHKLQADNIMINQLLTSTIAPMVSNIFLRSNNNIYPLIGRYAKEFSIKENQLIYKGMNYIIYLTLEENMWFYDIFLENIDSQMEVYYTQDIGLATEGHVRNNEAYNSHYIDHKVFETKEGFCVCSRQNQLQPHPFLQQGCFNNAIAFSVDGYPFFGLDYKFNNKIGDLYKERLNNRLYQYEFAYTSLQTEKLNTKHITFYGAFKPSLPTRIIEPIPISDIKAVHDNIIFNKPKEYKSFAFADDLPLGMDDIITSEPLTIEEINNLYPERRHEEYFNNTLLSFFTPTSEHIVLMEKEHHVERPHGHIITNYDDIPHMVMTSTSYIYGVFESQIAVGNTSFNVLNTYCRNGLNVSKINGRRLMIKIGSAYKTLAMPAVYEMGFNYAKWIYKINNNFLTIISCIGTTERTLKLVVKSEKKYDFLLVDDIQQGVVLSCENNNIHAVYNKDSMQYNAYPELKFTMKLDCDFKLTNDKRFYPSEGSQNTNTMVIEINNTGFTLITTANENNDFDIESEIKIYRERLINGVLNFKINHPIADKFNDIVLWYSHNARVHYASPHGLEQCNGAAWGLRDVCQGPFEYFLVTQNFEVCKYILRIVYAQQYIENGNWPQWFMFDNYYLIQHHESHGDIILWPLKALNAYLQATKDFDFLSEVLPYTSINGYDTTDEEYNIFEHVKREIQAIKDSFIGNTHLSCYGGGDWDDTLQPANKELAKNMTSGWTVALTYEVFNDFARIIEKYDESFSKEMQKLAEAIKSDFQKLIIKDDVAAGFLLFEKGGVEYLLHPADNKTGIQYRLLPMIRGIISGIFDKEQAEKHYNLIKEHMYHPDGVRLMNTTPIYRGGENLYFMRAETSASFAREVSLNYTHEQVRFLEAMATIKNADEVWKTANRINPILLSEYVKNNALRQSNVYFTSNDAAFDNRYEACENFYKIKSGDIPIKSGWRLYSSGSGIFINQFISKMLGLKLKGDIVCIEPVLPKELDGLLFSYRINNKDITIKYMIKGEPQKIIIDDKEIIGCEIPESLIKKGSKIFVYISDKKS